MRPVLYWISSQALTFPVRFLILLLTGAFCWLEPFYFPEKTVGGVTAILAQGHFLLSYIYQYKMGKMNQGFALRYLPVAIVLFAAALLVPMEKFLETLAALYFLIHFFYDERYLLGENADFSGWKIALPTIILLGGEIFYRYGGVPSLWLIFATFTLSISLMSWLLLTEIYQRRSISVRSGYFFCIYCVIALLLLPGKVLPGPVNLNALNFIILLHNNNWYWRHVVKFAPNRAALSRFFIGAVSVNLLMGGLMYFRFHSSFSPALTSLAGLFFLPPYFHIWSLLHFVATYRPKDIMNWIPTGSGGFPIGGSPQH